MENKEDLLERAQSAPLLDGRIAQNVGAQQTDLAEWIFERLRVGQGENVLELCCGTGGQTLKLAELVGESGRVVALDASREALDKLESKTRMEWRRRLALVEANLDDLPQALQSQGLQSPCFDLAFCGYGLYYSSDAVATMQEVKRWLRPRGRLVVVGPYGPNNGPLFDLLVRAGVRIPDYVKYTSTDFMFKEVIPWAAEHFQTLRVSTLVNRVSWPTAENVIQYWSNATFYDPDKLASVEALLDDHFRGQHEFVNEKWVMMVEASNARE